MPNLTPHQQFKNEHHALMNRWVDESDIEDVELAKIAMKDIEEWLDEETVDFDSDINLDEE